MKQTFLPCAHRCLWVAACTAMAFAPLSAVRAQNSNALSVDQMIEQLSGKSDAGIETGRTRALRPGAAVQGTVVPASNGALAPAPAPSKKAGGALSLQIQFDFASDQIAGVSREVVDRLAQALSSGDMQGFKFAVVGHTDGVGTAAYNMALSQRRAAAIKRYLVQHGVPAARISTEGRGMTELLHPDAPNAADNRRVEIKATSA